MSKVKIQGNASGTGIFTVSAPATNTDRTITLPDTSSTLLAPDSTGSIQLDFAGSNNYLRFISSANYVGRNSSTGDIWLNAQGGQSVILGINDTTQLKVDGNGRITTPSQPAFDASGGVSTFVTGDLGSACQWVANVNRGSNFSTSNGRFTAPISGVYYFWCHTIPQSDNNPTRTKLVKNGTAVYNINGNGARQIRGASGANTGFLAWIITLAANDYVYLNTDTGINTESAYLGFGGYLLG